MKVTTELRLTLELTAEEVAWLHETMRNPLSVDCDPDLEDLYDKKMREAFFVATKIEGLEYGS